MRVLPQKPKSIIVPRGRLQTADAGFDDEIIRRLGNDPRRSEGFAESVVCRILPRGPPRTAGQVVIAQPVALCQACLQDDAGFCGGPGHLSLTEHRLGALLRRRAASGQRQQDRHKK